MSSNALFATSNARGQQKNLIEFKAGKMRMEGKMVHPDNRRGLIYVYQSDDTLIHFCWKDRTTGLLEDDLIIFPDDCEFKRVPQCTTGRVYILKFKSSTRKFFFWMQDFKTDKDDETCKRVNEVLNNPPTPGSSRNAATPDGDLQNLLNNMSQSQLMQLFGNVGQMGNLSSILGGINRPSSSSSRSSSSATTSSSGQSSSSRSTTSSSNVALVSPSSSKSAHGANTSSVSSTNNSTASSKESKKSGNIKLSDVQTFLSNISVVESKNKDGTSTDDTSAFSPSTLEPILNNPDLIKVLLQSTEGSEINKDSGSGSFYLREAVRMFTAAVECGSLNPTINQFVVNAEAIQAVRDGSSEDFLKALQSAAIVKDQASKQTEKRKTSEESGAEAKKKDNKEDGKAE